MTQSNFCKSALLAALSFSALTLGCRDETSEMPIDEGNTVSEQQLDKDEISEEVEAEQPKLDPVAGEKLAPETREDPVEVLPAESNKEPVEEVPEDPSVGESEKPEIPLPPFVLMGEQHLLSQRSLQGQSFNSLEEFLTSAAGATLAREAGLSVQVGRDQLELVLSKNLALAFPMIGGDRSLKIKTLGHSLTLIGRIIRNVEVDTLAADRKSGDVKVYAIDEISGVFDLGGSNGVKGKDGSCPPGFENCLEVPGLSFAQSVLTPKVERKLVETTHHDIAAYADRIGFSSFTDVPPTSLQPNCQARSAPFSRKVEERFEGHLVTRKDVPAVSWQGELKGKDGWASPGQPGSAGQDAGVLEVIAVPGARTHVVRHLDGGQPGASGRVGVVLAAPAPQASSLSLESKITLDAKSAKKIYNYLLTYHMSFTGVCGGRMSCSCNSGTAMGKQTASPNTPELFWTETVQFQPPKTIAGVNPKLPEQTTAAKGRDGAYRFSEMDALETVSIGENEIPLEILLDLARSE